MNRRRRVWLLFAAGVGLALAAVAGISLLVLRLDREGAEARRRAIIEENVRLALWRMDATTSLFLARESLRPYFEFRALVPASRPWSELFAPPRAEERLVVSPLLLARPEHIRLYFQVEPDGRVTSPQVPPRTQWGFAAAQGAPMAQVFTARDALARMTPVLHTLDVPTVALLSTPGHKAPESCDDCDVSLDNAIPAQTRKNAREWQARNSYYDQAQTQVAPAPVEHFQNLPENVLVPIWRDKDLFLVRNVTVDGRRYLQGVWVDWPAMSASLLAEVRDLLPQASLLPASGPQRPDERRLASLPASLVPGALVIRDAAGGAPAWLVLLVAWLGVIVGSVAIGLLLLGAVELSERRGAFVSAVTHELRTPLTTFRMSTELLAEGMVPTKEQQQSYLETLRREADRLSHLVENVLSYSRIEQGRSPAQLEPMELGALLERIVPRLIERAGQGGMQLVSELPAALDGVRVRIDAAALEQILHNLVDNACKYAAGAADKRIHLGLASARRQVTLSVRDHGPGIGADVRRRLFEPFSKSAEQAAVTAPGVGLGLALCRQLARSRRGELRYAPAAGGGAVFELSIPATG